MAEWSLPRKARKSNFSTDEVDVLVDSVKQHYSVLYGKYAKRATNRWIRHKAWLDILKKVNGVSIEKRTLQEVKNKWKKCQYAMKEKVSRGILADDTSDNFWEDMDSMPLQERLSKVAAQEKIAQGSSSNQQVLKSQPLSPTKLKVTRQSPKVINKPPIEPPQSPVNEEMCLRWNSHHSNMQTAFPNILSKEQYVDVTLAAEGKTLKCHRLILSSCSPYFEEILSGISPFQHPVLFMRDIPFWILKSLCDFMYAGEVHIFQNKLEELLTVAEALKIKGLAGKSTPPENNNQEEANKNDNHNREIRRKQDRGQLPPPPPPPLKRNPHINPRPQNFESTSHDYEDDLLDPLDLLEPLYEEAAEEKKPSTVVKPKENKYQYQPVKKPFTRRLRKRKYSEQREPSPPPVFSFRKGTRSRPNVKIPKYYHSDYSTNKPPQNNTHQSDPLLDVDEIKTEPIDVEDNLIDYSDEDHHQYSIEHSIDSPIIITSAPPPPPPQDKFKKIKLTKPVITEVHTIEETNTTPGGLEVIKITVQQPEREDPLQVEQEPPPLGEAQEPENGSENPALEELEPPVLEKEIREVETEEEESITEQETAIQIQDVRSTAEEVEETTVTQNQEEERNSTENQEEEERSAVADQQQEEEGITPPDQEEKSDTATHDQEEKDAPSEETPEEEEQGVAQDPEEEEEKGAAQTQEEENSVKQTEEVRMEIADVRTTSLEESGDQNQNEATEREEEEDRRTTSLNHLEKEAMNVANAISMENRNENPDLDL